MSDSLATLWTVAHQAPLSLEFPRQELLEWVTISFPRGSSWPRDQTHICCMAGRFFITQASGKSKEAPQGIGKIL